MRRWQQPAGPQSERQQVDILVTARSFFNLGCRGREFRRIENDQVKGPGFVTETTQQVEHVTLQRRMTLGR
jgi:hypothetical protein